MSTQSDQTYDTPTAAKAAIAQLDLPDGVKSFVAEEIDRVAPKIDSQRGVRLRAMVGYWDDHVLVHVHPYYPAAQPHS